ncbi:MAG: cytochrome c oxidase subunit II [Blastocatellia bacterium]|nr:cytochrome c oxidase subunit II [Blastocatellia bacterium]
MLALCGGVGLTVTVFITLFAVKYRRRYDDEIPPESHESKWLEWGWTIFPFVAFVPVFFFSTAVYFKNATPPANAMEIYVTGRQWMWKFQHLDGQREINTLHVPVGKPIKLVMSSEDVIHSFFVPAFRIHMDVVPKKTTTTWFEATKAGEYHLFCSQYCGTEHANMIGTVYVMEPADYEKWLAQASFGGMALRGQNLFNKLACNSCHTGDAQARAPYLSNIYGKTIQTDAGEWVTVDENYIRESIYKPNAKIAAGYAGIMPTYEGQLSEEELQTLIVYLKAIGSGVQQAPPISNPQGVQPQPAGKNPDGTLPFKPDSAKPGTAGTEPAKQPEPAKPAPGQPAPTNPAPAKTGK